MVFHRSKTRQRRAQPIDDALTKAITPAPLAAPAPREPAAEAQNNPPIKGWLAVSLIIGLAVILSIAVALFVGLYVRWRAASRVSQNKVKEKAAAIMAVPCSVTFACSTCGKNLKVKVESVDKKVKCPHCSTVLLVPEAKER